MIALNVCQISLPSFLKNCRHKKTTKSCPYQAKKDGKEDEAMKEAKGHNQQENLKKNLRSFPFSLKTANSQRIQKICEIQIHK